ncbi:MULTISPECIES: FAD-binding oxidoreductase [unclassified Archaeoglobus]|jgi:glycolate oxidase|uniref:FAD-binding oxidoreductase n=1 Tax=unclassified Archaeoglobus TaxID=2643606 RepID=UPI0025C72C46|nr:MULTISPECIES: FAD-binding oxidoreductase [unclassified Archaeoglobus]
MDWVEELTGIIEVFPPSGAYAYDETPPLIAPKPANKFVVVKPKNANEVSEILKFASKRRIPIFTRGGGTGLSGGAIPTVEGIVLSTERMTEIKVDRENRIADCGAGVTLKQLDDAVFKHGLSFPPHPGAETATVGGMIATNAGGVRALKYGTMRNYVLALEVVLTNGRILEIGGKTIKNSSGYSLLHLFVGSEGTLGIITRAKIRLFPQLRDMTVLAVPFSTMEDAMDCVVEISAKMLPLALEFMEKKAVEVGERVSGEKWVSRDGEAHLLMIFESFDEAEGAAAISEKFGAINVYAATTKKDQDRLLKIRGLIYEGLRKDIIEILDVCVPPAKIAEYYRKSNEIAARYGVDLITYGHAGDGNVHQHPLIYDDWMNSYFNFREELLRLAVSYGGVISGEHGIGVVKTKELAELFPDQYRIMKEIKLLFDPQGILNPGKVVR